MQIKCENVIAEVIKALEEGNLIPTTHAQKQMKDRDIQLSDLEEALYRCSREEFNDRLTSDGNVWKYSLRGKNNTGLKDLRIIIIFKDTKVLVVTAIDKTK
ncbi:MAG: DUF4258 domain-containing protein [Bdellovibrionales bacterium]